MFILSTVPSLKLEVESLDHLDGKQTTFEL